MYWSHMKNWLVLSLNFGAVWSPASCRKPKKRFCLLSWTLPWLALLHLWLWGNVFHKKCLLLCSPKGFCEVALWLARISALGVRREEFCRPLARLLECSPWCHSNCWRSLLRRNVELLLLNANMLSGVLDTRNDFVSVVDIQTCWALLADFLCLSGDVFMRLFFLCWSIHGRHVY